MAPPPHLTCPCNPPTTALAGGVWRRTPAASWTSHSCCAALVRLAPRTHKHRSPQIPPYTHMSLHTPGWATPSTLLNRRMALATDLCGFLLLDLLLPLPCPAPSIPQHTRMGNCQHMAQPEDAADGKLTWTKALPAWEPLAGYPPLQGCALGLEYSGVAQGAAVGRDVWRGWGR